MTSRYEPKEHIQHLEVAPRAEILLDQREITIQSYQATVLFDLEALKAGIDSAWLTPQIPFGVFAHDRAKDHDSLSVVLGLQDSLSIRAYDYEERRPLWYLWQNAIVDTVNVHDFFFCIFLTAFKSKQAVSSFTSHILPPSVSTVCPCFPEDMRCRLGPTLSVQ